MLVNRCQWVYEDYISGLKSSSVLFISNGTTKTKLAILAFLCCEEFMKNRLTDLEALLHGYKYSQFHAVFFWQECIPVWCIPSAAVVICWGCLPRGCLIRGVFEGGCLPRGVSARGVYTSPLGTEFLTHACENIFPQLRLRTVKIKQNRML